MSRSRFVPALLTLMVGMAACTGKNETPITVHPASKAPTVTSSKGAGSTAPSASATTPAPSAPASADSSATPAVVLSPPIYHPSASPTTGGVSPLPSNAFPTDPPSKAPSPGSGTPTPVPTPVVTPTPGSPSSMTVLSNNLDAGTGSIGGVVFGPPTTVGGEPTTVGGGTILIVDESNNAKKAQLLVGDDGTYRLGSLKLGTYLVSISKTGFTADTTPTEVTLSIGLNQNSNTPLVLVQTVPFPSAQ